MQCDQCVAGVAAPQRDRGPQAAVIVNDARPGHLDPAVGDRHAANRGEQIVGVVHRHDRFVGVRQHGVEAAKPVQAIWLLVGRDPGRAVRRIHAE